MRIQRRHRQNRRFMSSGTSNVIVVDKTGNHKANYVLFEGSQLLMYVVVFYSLKTATRYATNYERSFHTPMPIYDRSGKEIKRRSGYANS